MENINLTNLIKNTQNNKNKSISGFTSSENMFEFLKIQNNTFKFVKNLTVYDLSSWIISKHTFISKSKKKNKYISFKRGTIIFADFGVNFNGEISYNHPGVILSETLDKVLVAPCSSGRLNKVFKDQNDPTTIYPQYLIGETAHGFSKQTVVLLDDVRWISKNRILNSFNIVDSSFFANLQDSFLKLFADVYTNKMETLNNLKELQLKEIEALNNLKESHLKEIENLKLKIKENEEIINKLQNK